MNLGGICQHRAAVAVNILIDTDGLGNGGPNQFESFPDNELESERLFFYVRASTEGQNMLNQLCCASG